MSKMIFVGDIKAVTDQSMADTIRKEGSESQKAVEERLGPALAGQPVVAEAAAAAAGPAAVEAVGRELDESPRVMQLFSSATWSLATRSLSKFVPFGVRRNGDTFARLAPDALLPTANGHVTARQVGDALPPVAGAFAILKPSTGWLAGFLTVGRRVAAGIDVRGDFRARYAAHSIPAEAVAQSLCVADSISEWHSHPMATWDPATERVWVPGLSSDARVLASTWDKRSPSRTIVAGKTAKVDDHNVPALWQRDGHRPVLAWTEHGETVDGYIRLGNVGGGPDSFLRNAIVTLPVGLSASYTVIQYLSQTVETGAAVDHFWVFVRRGSSAWSIVPMDVPQTDGALPTFGTRISLTSSPSQQTYLQIADAVDHVRIGWTPNPDALGATRHDVAYFHIDKVTGAITSPIAGFPAANVLTGTGLPLDFGSVPKLLPDTNIASTGVTRRAVMVRDGLAGASPAYLYQEGLLADPGGTWRHKVIDVTTGTIVDLGPTGKGLADGTYTMGSCFPVAPPAGDDTVYTSDWIAGVSTLRKIRWTSLVKTVLLTSGRPLFRPYALAAGAPIRLVVNRVIRYAGTGYSDFYTDQIGVTDA